MRVALHIHRDGRGGWSHGGLSHGWKRVTISMVMVGKCRGQNIIRKRLRRAGQPAVIAVLVCNANWMDWNYGTVAVVGVVVIVSIVVVLASLLLLLIKLLSSLLSSC